MRSLALASRLSLIPIEFKMAPWHQVQSYPTADRLAILTTSSILNLNRVSIIVSAKKSVATLSVCGEWGGDNGKGNSGDDEAALEMSSARVWVQGRAPAARLSSLQAAWAATAEAKAAAPSSPLAAFELRFILLQGREVEGVWPAEAVAGVLANLEGAASPAETSGTGGGSSSAAAASSNPVAANA